MKENLDQSIVLFAKYLCRTYYVIILLDVEAWFTVCIRD
jgi:hypothetical protein